MFSNFGVSKTIHFEIFGRFWKTSKLVENSASSTLQNASLNSILIIIFLFNTKSIEMAIGNLSFATYNNNNMCRIYLNKSKEKKNTHILQIYTIFFYLPTHNTHNIIYIFSLKWRRSANSRVSLFANLKLTNTKCRKLVRGAILLLFYIRIFSCKFDRIIILLDCMFDKVFSMRFMCLIL